MASRYQIVCMVVDCGSLKRAADELGYTGDKSDSASMNIWLHAQVIQKIKDNGGRLPTDL